MKHDTNPTSHRLAETREFWADGKNAYATLSYLSNPDDWAAIIDTIAAYIAQNTDSNKVRLLDIGSGNGSTIHAVSKRLLTTHGVTSHVSLVEPSEKALDASKLVISQSPHSFGSGEFYKSISDIEAHDFSFDFILFIHSSYYISDLNEYINYILRSNKISNSIFLFLVLPDNSPFFLGAGRNSHLNCFEEVLESCTESCLKTSVHNVTSRICVPDGIWSDQNVIKDWSFFMAGSGFSCQEIGQKLRTHLTDGSNLGDRLVIAQE